MSLISVTSKI